MSLLTKCREDDREGLSEVEGEEEEFVPERAPVDIDVRARTIAVGMASLDMVDMHEVFQRRAMVMRTVPVFLKGAFKAALRVALEERILGEANGDFIKVQRAWKLFMLLPRMILFRPPRGGKVPRKQLEERCQAFARGDWMYLVRQSMQAAEQGSVHASRWRRRHRGDDVNRRAARALRLVQLGEVSSARQAVEGAEVAPGTLDTLNHLRDENRRPPEDIVNAHPEHPFTLDCEQFLLNLRSSQRGAAAGPLGMTADI